MSRWQSQRRWFRITKPHIFFNLRTREWDVHLPFDLARQYGITMEALDFAERLNSGDSRMKEMMTAQLKESKHE